nr:BamA/TamA family outer membrane protein [Deltaproteobacteria bacterium]
LYDLGRFGQVRVFPERAQGTDIVPVTITVSVAGRHELKGGGGLGYEPATYEARLRGGFTYIPQEYPLLSLNFDGRLALSVGHDFVDYEPRTRLFFNVQRLEFFRPFVIGDVGAGLEYFTLESYTARGPILRTGVSAPLGKRWLTGQAAWNFTYFEFFDIDPLITRRDQARFGLRDNERNGRFEQSIAADLRDKPLEPRKGAYLGLRVIEGGSFAGGAFTYLEIQPDLRGYLPIGKLSSFAFRVRGGAFLGDVPVTQRYFSGGAQNHRGFSSRVLAPVIAGTAKNEDGTDKINPMTGELVADETPIGGEVFLETGAELRIPLGELSGLMFGTTLFLDGGDVVQQNQGLDLLNLHWAAGVGLFVKFGGFKIRIDVGRRLNRLGASELDPRNVLPNTNLFLGVGETY